MRRPIAATVRAALVLCLFAAGPSEAAFWISADGDIVGESGPPDSGQLLFQGRSFSLRGETSSLVSPSVNLAVTTAPAGQFFASGIPDGAGGMIVTWYDGRDRAVSGFDIYAHHILACGQLDPTWPAGGVAVTRAPDDDVFPVICSDGSGGAFIAWNARFNVIANRDVFAQHLLASGTLDPAWPVNGLGVCTSPASQILPKIVHDGGTGAFVAWDDQRAGRFVFAHHLQASGVDPGWAVNGIRVCPGSAFTQTLPVVCSDGSGGVLVAFGDARAGVLNRDIYAQRISAAGALLWSPAGMPVTTAPLGQILNAGPVANSAWIVTYSEVQSNAIVPDGSGGCLITWGDQRFVPIDGDIFAQRLTSSGSVAAGWPADGVPLCTAAGAQNGSVLLADGAGGAYATWQEDARPAPFVQHVTGAGLVTGPVDGLAMSSAAMADFTPVGVSDGSGGAIFTWSDDRNLVTTDYDIFAQHVVANPSVTLDPLWPADGVTVSDAAGVQFQSGAGSVVQSGSGGAIIVWEDTRDLGTSDVDLYAQGLQANGALGGAAVAPVASITGPASGSVFPVNTPVSFTGTFTDDDPDVHAAQWEFDALPPAPGVVNEATKTVTLNYSFPSPGVYSVRLTVTDGCGASSSSNQVDGFDALVVIYDPSAGFVTGGGWIDSPAGAHVEDPSLVGKANFGFVAKYLKGANIPTGNTEFQFKAADLNFSSSSYEWLVVSGARAQYRGLGTINGVDGFRFMLTAIDGNLLGNQLDRFRMKITSAATDALVYDNQLSAPDDSDPTTALGGGSVVIHKPKGGAAASEPSEPSGGSTGLPARFALSHGEPNPFNLESVIRLTLPEQCQVDADLLDVSGRRVQSLLHGDEPAGEHFVRIAARDGSGRALAPGLYFLHMEVRSLSTGVHFTAARRLILTR